MSSLCFFSARCPHSKNFLEALSQSPYSKEFKFICVDAQPGRPRPQLPEYVKSVPTLMIAGERDPREGGSAALNWLAEKRLMAGRGGGSAPPPQPRGPPQPAPGAGPRPGSVAFPSRIAGPAAAASKDTFFQSASGDGLMAYTSDMSCNGDDSFCLLDEMTVAPTSGSMVSMTGNFVAFNDLGDGGQMAPQAAAAPGGGGPRQTEKSRALQDAFDRMQQQRANDIPGAPRRM
jgi:hypothetical protein